MFYLFKVAPPPTVVKVTRTSPFTPGSLKVTWTAASPVNLNGDIKAYNIKYQVIAPEAQQNYTLVTKPNDGTNGEFIIDKLPPCSAVSIEVCLYRFACFLLAISLFYTINIALFSMSYVVCGIAMIMANGGVSVLVYGWMIVFVKRRMSLC